MNAERTALETPAKAVHKASWPALWRTVSSLSVRAVLAAAVALSLLSTAIAVIRAKQELRTGLLIAGTSALISVLFLIGYLIRSAIIARRHLNESLRAQAEADAARTRLVEAIENINEGFVLFDADGRMVLCNQHYRDCYPLVADLMQPGSSFEDIYRRGLERGQEPPSAASLQARVAERLAQRRGGVTFEQELSDGRWLRVSDRPTRDGGFVGIRADITELKRRELALTEAREWLQQQTRDMRELANEAQRANAAKSDFLALISHEIRTPINAIVGFSELLRDTPMTEQQERFAKSVEEAAKQLLVLVNSVLDFSRLEIGRLELEPAAFDLRTVIDTVTDIASGLVAGKPVSVSAQVAKDVPSTLVGDSARLYQVLLNLISNAVKFTDEGRVEVRVEKLGEAADGVRLRFEVCDTGTGIDAELKPRLFRPFEQGRSAAGRRGGGSGLGLAICRKIVDLMDGRIGLDDRPEGGSVFYVEVVMPRGTAPAPEAVPVVSLAAPQRMRVLVAEDTPASQLVIKTLLEKRGHRVHVVGDGAEAVEAARALAFDAILLDIQMPIMDGYEAARRIRRLPPPYGKAAIVALTAQAMPTDRQQALAAGMTDHVSKPVRPALLYALLDRLAEGKPVTETASKTETSLETENLAPVGSNADDAADEIEVAKMLELRRAVGAPVFERLVSRFFENAEARLQEIDATIRAADAERLRRDAHGVIGLFSQFGLTGVARMAREVETAPDPASTLAVAGRLVAAGSIGLVKLRERLAEIGREAPIA
jgi:signal transduction histidine kinase/CheY-like chemotaxis protein/HPt (histidine-containing phosphotransfer) domain-containing protein